MEVVKKSKIEIEIGLDKDNFPAEINWSSTDAPVGYPVQNANCSYLGSHELHEFTRIIFLFL